MKDETDVVAIEEFVALKSKIYSFLVDDSNKHKKGNGVNGNVVAAVSHNKCKDVLLNYKCLRHSINKIQSKDHQIANYEIKTISFACFDDKIYIRSNGFD